MALKVYEYKNCGTCKKALKFLDENDLDYKKIAVRETPPSESEIKKMLKYLDGDLKKLFNTSGQDYRAMNLKDKIKTITEKEAISLLTKNGNLVKRPFVLGTGWGTVGFKEEVWKEALL
ncbi:MAG: arsenate reductase family protein [Bdellovibrionales bacterium]|jgi:arsenate reductase|nr:arsenate reductase family protein [Bdellovibrionales bacterium]